MEKEKDYIIDRIPRLLKAEEIECRVGTIRGNGLTLLLYKDARTDMRILNETYGIGYWQRTHEVINGNLFCNIEVWNDKINQWVKKQDVGTESFTEKEKGEASDSLKRAGFNFGIGVELYTSPFIWITPRKDMKPNIKDLNNEPANEFYLYKQNAYTTKTVFKVSKIGYNDNREINKLEITDNKGNIRFSLVPQKEQKEIFNLMVKVNELVAETPNIDFETITNYYKVNSTSEMTIEQLKDCVKNLEEKKRRM